MERNYYERCFVAFYWTLNNIFRQSKKPIAPHPFSLCDLLSDMCPFTFATGVSADPAAYYDYEKILKSRVTAEEDATLLNGYTAGREFLQMYMTEYEYELGDTIEKFSLDDYSIAYEKLKQQNAQ